MKTPNPYAHQAKESKAHANDEARALFWEMGTGKTKTIIDQFIAGPCQTLVVLAPKSVVYLVWLREWKKWVNKCSADKMYAWSSRTTNKNIGTQGAFLHYVSGESDGSQSMLLCNIEALSQTNSKAQRYILKVLQASKCMLVVDESTCIKNFKAKRTKNVTTLGGHAFMRRILTGTPITQSPMDLFAMFRFLDGRIFGRSYYAFRSRYAVLEDIYVGVGKIVKVISGFQRLNELTKKIEPYSSRIMKIECLDLPPKVYETYNITMKKEQQTAYNHFAENGMLELESGSVIAAPIMLTRILRLRQILCGFLGGNELSEEVDLIIETYNNERLCILTDIISEMSGRVVIWAHFRPSVAQIVDVLSVRYGAETIVEYHGGVKDKTASIDKFIDPKSKVRFFVGTPQSGKFSLTLCSPKIDSCNMIFFNNDFSLETRQQAEDRIHRIGQENKCTYVDLVCRGTVDDKILALLKAKRQFSKDVFGDELKEWFQSA